MAPGFWSKFKELGKKVLGGIKNFLNVADPIVQAVKPAVETVLPQSKIGFDIYDTAKKVVDNVAGGGYGPTLPPYGGLFAPYKKKTGTEFLAPIMSKMYRG